MKGSCFECRYLAQIKTAFETSPQYICSNPDNDILLAKQTSYYGTQSLDNPCNKFKKTTDDPTLMVFNKFISMQNYYDLIMYKSKIPLLVKPNNIVVRFNNPSII